MSLIQGKYKYSLRTKNLDMERSYYKSAFAGLSVLVKRTYKAAMRKRMRSTRSKMLPQSPLDSVMQHSISE